MTSNFKIFTWNVNGMGSYKKRRKVFNWLIKHSSTNSIFMLQETHSTALVHDKNGRILIIDTEIQIEHYVIINYYGNNDQHGQLETLSVLESLLDKINFKLDTKIILGGDFNVIFNTFLDNYHLIV